MSISSLATSVWDWILGLFHGAPSPGPAPAPSPSPAPTPAPTPSPSPAPTPAPAGSRFALCMPPLLANEGGYVDDPRDPGGATDHGITQATYDAWLRLQGLPSVPVAHIAMTDVYAIYRAQYWTRADCDQLPPGVDYVVFDGAVNSGVRQSVEWLQAALGVTVDGVVGVVTLSAVHAADPETLIGNVLAERMDFLRGLSTWDAFGRGWTNRVNDVRRQALTWAGRPSVVASFVRHVD